MTATSMSRAGALSPDYRLAPLPAAICYPLFLSCAYGGMHGVPSAPSVEARVAAIFMTVVSVAAAFAVPWVAALTAARIARSPQRSRADAQRYRLAHLAFAAPPLYTGVGVITSVIGIGPFDFVIWLALWLGLGLFVAAAPADVSADDAHPPRARAVAIHGSIAAAVLVVFLVWHLVNHALALWSPALHQSAMKRLEHVYRARAIEPLLIDRHGAVGRYRHAPGMETHPAPWRWLSSAADADGVLPGGLCPITPNGDPGAGAVAGTC
jgi:hypothetical protein